MEYSEWLQRRAKELVALCNEDVDFAWDALSVCMRGELSEWEDDVTIRHWLYRNAPLRSDAQALQGCLKDL